MIQLLGTGRFFDLPPEEKLIEWSLREGRGNSSQPGPAISLIKKQKIRWPRFLRLVKANNLYTIAYSLLQQREVKKNVPPQVLQELGRLDLALTHLIGRQTQESQRIFRRLNQEKVNYIVMKTFALRKEIFGRKATKLSLDLDLLVPISDFRKSSEVLFQSGYRHYPKGEIGPGSATMPSKHFYVPKSQESFRKDNQTIEVHSTIVDTFYFVSGIINDELSRRMTEELFRGTRTIGFNGEKVKVFSPNNLLLSMFLHAFFQHNLQGGATYYEFTKILQRYEKEIDWRALFSFVRKYRLEIYFLWFLALFDDIFPKLLPQKVHQRVNILRKSLSPPQQVMFAYMRYKVFHPTLFAKSPSLEREKEWSWAVINQEVLRVFFLKVKKRLLP